MSLKEELYKQMEDGGPATKEFLCGHVAALNIISEIIEVTTGMVAVEKDECLALRALNLVILQLENKITNAIEKMEESEHERRKYN